MVARFHDDDDVKGGVWLLPARAGSRFSLGNFSSQILFYDPLSNRLFPRRVKVFLKRLFGK